LTIIHGPEPTFCRRSFPLTITTCGRTEASRRIFAAFALIEIHVALDQLVHWPEAPVIGLPKAVLFVIS
jgi:hypothetical protein